MFAKSVLSAVAAAFLLAATSTAEAQGYPSRPVRLVVGFPAGGGSDTLARKFAERLQPRLGQPVLVENKPGAGAAIAAQSVVQSDPDGLTLYVAGGSVTAFKVFNKDVTFDVQKDLAPAARFAESIAMLVIHSKTPATNLREFIALVKANPGKFVYASPGGTVRLGLENLRRIGGLDMLHVQYKGEADYTTALLGEQVHFIIGNPATQQGNLQAGRVRFLAVTTMTRSAVFPDVPTANEAGLPGWDYTNWNGILVPVNTPRPIIERLEREVLSIARGEEYREDTLKWSRGGYQASPASGAEFAAQIATETKLWSDIARMAKVE